MEQIRLTDIRKVFRVHERPEGRFGALRGAFHRKVREVHALRDISFSIAEGELVGYIGPNGSGKSTSVKVMSGILTPDGGECVICGRVPWKQRVEHVAHIGVVFGQRSQLWWDVPVSDSFDLLRDIYAIPGARYGPRRAELVEALDIGDLLKTPVRQLSLGQRMRCELAAALLHSPKILFLDEPTIGLDAVSKLSLRAFLKEENRRHGITMLLTTHDMDDIEALCQRVMVIGHGKLLYDGGMESLRAQYSPAACLRIQLEGAFSDLSGLRALPGVLEVRGEEPGLQVRFDARQTPTHEMIAAISQRAPVTDISIQEQNIDEMIAAMYKDLDLA